MRIFKLVLALAIFIGVNYSCTNKEVTSDLQKEEISKPSHSEASMLGVVCPHHRMADCKSSPCEKTTSGKCIASGHVSSQNCINQPQSESREIEDHNQIPGGGGTPEPPKPCEECEKCLACKDVKEGKKRFEHIHTCKCVGHEYCSADNDPQ